MQNLCKKTHRSSTLLALQGVGNVQHVIPSCKVLTVTPPIGFYTLGNMSVNLQIHSRSICKTQAHFSAATLPAKMYTFVLTHVKVDGCSLYKRWSKGWMKKAHSYNSVQTVNLFISVYSNSRTYGFAKINLRCAAQGFSTVPYEWRAKGHGQLG